METVVPDRPFDPAVASPSPRWSLALRVGFRLAFIYFGLYVISTQMLNSLVILPFAYIPNLGSLRSTQRAVVWVAHHVFQANYEFPTTLTGSGDRTVDWVLNACLLAIAIVGAGLWSLVDRRRPNHAVLHTWFQVFVRFSLGATMISYGMLKAFPLQMSYPNLTRLLEPYGNFSPMGVLWASIGAAPGYERFAGSMELMAGILLFVPRLSTLGAMVAFADAVQIFLLNMTYDVPVKLFAFQLILMSLYLLAPEMPRLTRAVILNGSAGPSPIRPLARRRAVALTLTLVQVFYGGYIVAMHYWPSKKSWASVSAPKPPLYGIWTVERMTVDGVERAPLISDYGRWRRIVIQNGATVWFQRMDDSFVTYPSRTDVSARTLTLTRQGDQSSNTVFSYQLLNPDQLVLDGTMNGRRIELSTRLFDRSGFQLVSRGFHWIQEHPFNK